MQKPDVSHCSRITFWLTVLVAFAAFIRLNGATGFYFHSDEAINFGMAAGSTLMETIRFSMYETHPSFGTVLYHFWAKLSHEPDMLRGLALLFGLALVVLYYHIGKAMDGKLAGFTAAALVAFSYGCIMQSFVLRSYMAFLFFLSAAFYAYLCWRKNPETRQLEVYLLCALFACLINFSTAFGIFCIGMAELLIFRTVTGRKRIAFIVVHAVLAAVWLSLYYLWLPTMTLAQNEEEPASLLMALARGLVYPPSAFVYLLPAMYVGFFSAFLLPLTAIYLKTPLRKYVQMGWFALGLGVMLNITGLYPTLASRHSLWVFPFIIPVFGCIIAGVCVSLLGTIPFIRNKGLVADATAIVLLVSGWLMYDPLVRFADSGEYGLDKPAWEATMQALGKTPPTQLLVAERSDAWLITMPAHNPYLDMIADDKVDPAEKGVASYVVMPYGKSRLLFKRFYMNYDAGTFITMFKDAKQKGLLDGVETVSFFIMNSSRTIAANFLKCEELDKTVTELAARGLIKTKLVSVPTTALFDQLIAPEGKAHHCLSTPKT